MIKKRRLQKIIPQVVVAVVLLGLFLGFMALRHPSPLKAPRLTQSSAMSNSLYYASNRSYSVKIGERNTNKPTIEYSLPTGNKVSFTYSDLKGQTAAPAVKDGTITFKNVSPNVDLKYTTLPNGLKEEVILNKQVSGNIFKFSLNAADAFPRAQTDSLFSSTFFDKNGQYLFHFEKPFAVDAKGSRSDNVSFQIKKERNNTYTITLDVDQGWLQSTDRAYPISIDPTIIHDTTSEFATGQMNRIKDTGTGSSPVLESYFQELPTDPNTVLLWHLNEASGNPIDSSGNSNTGTDYNTTVITGPLSNARNFNGSNAYIQSGSLTGLKTGNVVHSVEAWVKPNALPTTRQWPLILGTATNNNVHWLWNSTGIFNIGIFNIASCNLYPKIGEWNHIAYTYDGAVMNCYLDGVYVGRVASTALSLANTVLTIGQVQLAEAYFNGSFDEVRVSNVVRTAEEIRLDASRRPYSTYTSDVLDLTYPVSWNSFKWEANRLATGDGETATPSATSNLVAQWNFNETSGTTAISGGTCSTTCNATLYNMTTTGQDAGLKTGWTSAGRRWGVGALMFDGSNDYAEITDNNNLDLTTAGTLEIWAYKYTQKNAQMYISKGPTTSYQLLDYGTTGKISFRWGTDSDVLWSNDVVPINTWTHIVGVYDGSFLYIYINGRISAKKAYTTNAVANANALRIGARSDGYYFLGILDGAKIYNRALTENEIFSNYNRGRVELQTRVGGTTTPNDGTWEAWRPVTSETVLDNLDNPLNIATPSASIINAIPIATSSSTVIKAEGNASLNIQQGIPKVLPGTVGLWHLDETGGTSAYLKDSSGNANHGTPTGTTLSEGISGKTRSFNGSSDLISLGNPSSLQISGALSIEAWVKTSAAVAYRGIAGKMGTGSPYYGYVLRTNSSGYANFGVSSNGTAFTEVAGTAAINDGKWHHLAGVYTPSTSLRIYVDGVLQNTNSTSIPASIYNTSGNAVIGCTYTTPSECFNGSIDEVRISNIARTQEEIAEAYRAGRDSHITETFASSDFSSFNKIPFYIASDRLGTFSQLTIGESAYANADPDTSTIALWPLNEVSGSTNYLKDYSGNANHGTPTGTTITQGYLDKGRNFNGTSDYVKAATSTSLNSPTSMSVSAWINTTDTGVNRPIVGKSTGCATAGYLMWLNQNSVGAGIISFWSPTGGWINSTVTVNDGKWHHVVATNDNTTTRIYIDGVLNNTGAGSGSRSSTTELQIGGSTTGAGCTGMWYTGIIDEVRIDNVVRTADEIRQAYEIGARTHIVTIDFKAVLNSGNLITGSGDTGFTVDETSYGSSAMADHLFQGDKIIIKENYDGTEYLAQGTVSTVNSATGAVTVTAWDTGSTFPSGGYTVNATVFKWQREYFDVTQSLPGHRDAITRLTYRISDGSTGGNIWLDDFRASTGYLNTPSGSTITSSLGNRYFQYRGILTQNDLSASSSALLSVSLDYTQNSIPAIPSLNYPADTQTNLPLSTTLATKTYDDDNDYIRYKIHLCTDLAMTQNCQVFDQTVSQTGWSGQNIQGNTAYTSNTEAVYQPQSLLNSDTTYYWRSYAIDPAGRNTWSATQATPYSFTTTFQPDPPTNLLTNDVTNNPTVNTASPVYFSALYIDSDSDNGTHYQVEVNTNNAFTGTVMWDSTKTAFGAPVVSGDQTGDITYAGSALATNTTYYWRIKIWDVNGAVSPLSSVGQFTMNTKPTTPTLDSPSNSGTGVPVLAVLKTTGTDADSNYLRYKIELCTNLAMTTNCQTFDQTVSQTGWSGQNTQTNTAYTSGTQATYTLQSALNPNTIYYWRSYAIDPAGINSWSSTQGTPYSFTTSQVPNNPTFGSPADAATNQSLYPVITTTATDNDSDVLRYKIELCTNLAMTTNCQTFDQTVSTTGWSASSYASGATGSYTIQTALSTNITYYWRTYAIDQAGSNTWSGTQSPPRSFTTSNLPNTPSLDQPTNTQTDVIAVTIFKTTTTDTDGDYLRYKITICDDVNMGIGCQTFSQTTSQTGWSGKDAQGGTAYSSGTQATYTMQSALTAGKTYYWKSYAIDPAGSNSWSTAQSTPYSFTIKNSSAAPAPCNISKAPNNGSITVNWTDTSNEEAYQVWKVTDGGLPAQLGTNLAANTIQVVDSAVSINHSYGYLVRGLRTDGGTTLYSPWCSTTTTYLSSGALYMEGINFD